MPLNDVTGQKYPLGHPPPDVPLLVPLEVPLLVPLEVPLLVPLDVPLLVPLDVPLLVPLEVPLLVPLDVPLLVPLDVPLLVPLEVPLLVPLDVPLLVPLEVPLLVPLEVPLLVPLEVPSLVPPEVPSPVPLEVPALVPAEVPLLVPVIFRRPGSFLILGRGMIIVDILIESSIELSFSEAWEEAAESSLAARAGGLKKVKEIPVTRYPNSDAFRKNFLISAGNLSFPQSAVSVTVNRGRIKCFKNIHKEHLCYKKLFSYFKFKLDDNPFNSIGLSQFRPHWLNFGN